MTKKILKVIKILIIMTNIVFADNDIENLENVTVTANKIEENIQYIPQSITVLDHEEIEAKEIKTISDVINEIPNMTSTPDRGIKVNFRGINASLFTENNPVVVYIDGIPISAKRSYITSFENIERVEVLRGPQSTLYGKDAIGGVINIITKEPNNETNGSIGFEYGSDNYMRNTFNINTPIIKDKLFFNINGDIFSDNGWITNTYNGDDKAAKENNRNFSTSLYYKVTDKLSTKLLLKNNRSKNYGFNGYGIATIDPFGTPIYPNFSDFKRDAAENHGFEMSSYEKYTINSQALSIKYDNENYTFNSTTTHSKTNVNGKYDADYTNGTYLDNSTMFNDETADNYSQEFRISNKQDNGIRWLGGIYLDTEDKNYDPYGTHTIMYGTDIGKTNMKSNLDSDTQAIFGQAIIPLDEQFDLTLGARYQRIKKKIDYEYYNNNVKLLGYNSEKTWNTFIPKIALDYKLNDNFSPFISISRGYMPGGFNTAATTSNIDDNTFEPQQSTNYEMGIKGDFKDFYFTASLFRMDIKDIHVYRRLTSGQVYTDNADKAHSQGIEFDFHYFPTSNLEITGAFGIIQTEYDSYNVGDYNFSGNKIETTPSHTANLSIIYNNPSGFYARTDVRNQGSMYFYDDLNKSFVKEDSYTLINAKIGYKFSDWDIYIFGKNLTDEKYINMYETNSYFSYASFGDPRFFGLGIKYTF
ncbi:TonB-dependent receptor [Halarcobacter ebronensis]|uniref:TonB-dependent siderophore receptor n=1 Tax=Halarcobacter ebronensis TaxID=1462615 RepID=A0A4Q1AJL4_9BACT|nr:TonB-dependent receptor [Halarcobacter ebronensis]RXK04560.1 TonB-dependent siderophore receptor [Halarcobacter ebronensis]